MPDETIHEEQLKLMRKSLIVQLGMLGVTQKKIRAIVECDMSLVSEVMKVLEPKKIIEKRGG